MQPKKTPFNPLVIAHGTGSRADGVVGAAGGTGGSASGSYHEHIPRWCTILSSNQVTKFTLDLNTGVITLTLKEGDTGAAATLPSRPPRSPPAACCPGCCPPLPAAPTGR